MTFWKRQDYGDSKKNQCLLAGRREGRMNKWNRIFRAVKILCMVL